MELPESIGCVLRAMRTILAWQTSCRHIFKKAQILQKCSQLFKLQYKDEVLHPCVLPVAKATHLIQGWEGPTADPCDEARARQYLEHTLKAKVHAEAALMHWLATVQVWLL